MKHTIRQHFINGFGQRVTKIKSIQGELGSGVRDKFGKEIVENDIIQIDFAPAAKLIGEGSLIRDLLTVRPKDARLVVEFRNARFWVVWRNSNCAADCSIDLYLLECISNYIEIVGHKAMHDS